MKAKTDAMFAFVLFLAVAWATDASRAQAGTSTAASSTEASSSSGKDPVDVALEYVHASVHQVQHDNQRLSNQLAEAEQSGRDTREQMSRAAVKLQEIPRLKSRMHSLLAEKASMLSQLSQEWKREKSIAGQLQNVSRISLKRARVLARARQILSKELRANAVLSQQLANTTSVNAELVKAAATAQYEKTRLQMAEHDKDMELERSRAFIGQMRTSLHALQDAQTQDRAKQAGSALATQHALTQEHKAEGAFKKTSVELHASQAQVGALRAKVIHEAQLNSDFASRLAVNKVSFEKLAQEQRSEQKQEAEMQKGEHDLRQEILASRKKLAQAESLRQQAQNQAASAKDDLFTAQSQVQEVKGTMPWLQAKVTQEELEANNATAATAEALRERDETRASLAAARQKIVHMEQQYSQIVKMVGTNAAKGQAADADSNLTALVRDAVEDVPGQAPEMQDGDAPPMMSGQPADAQDTAGPLPLPSMVASSARGSLRGLGSAPVEDASETDDGNSGGLEKDSKGLEDMLSAIVPDSS